MLEPARRHELRADADAEKRPASLAHSFVQRFDHAGDAVKPTPAVGERADARQDDVLGRKHFLRP